MVGDTRYITVAEVPVGYTTPPFPSLFWPLNDSRYSLAQLFYARDIWLFTMAWTLIFFGLFYTVAGIWAAFAHRRKPLRAVIVLSLYIFAGAFQGFMSGSIVGVVVGAAYRAGLFQMSTWVPLCCGVLQILFNVVTSYSLMCVVF